MTNMNTSAPTKNTNKNTKARKKKANKNTNAQTKEINKNTSTRTNEANMNTNIQTKDTNEGTDVYKKMIDDLAEAVPSNDKDPERALGATDAYTMTTEHAELYKKLIRDLTETVPTNDKAYDPWGRTKTIKESDDTVIAQLSTDIIDRLETILRNATDPASIVFYNTMKGSYYDHMAEYLTDHDKRKKTIYQDQALSAFLTAKESATSSGMSVNDPIYLELHISLAKLYYFMRLYRPARLTNIWAYNASRKCKDRLDEEDHNLLAAINERMRKLMNRWTDNAMRLTY
ncbi:hypothetical protein BG011_000096 [Mortierella polycephala]|uniref:14-3-3 domain-containing protein n=1 Tax=Mortierella polycephala TaxID=41804 RepID=A0A9P6TVW0_9FUNG|nr:hypothetical protein BG011_000096 [Mortierella polycephala]